MVDTIPGGGSNPTGAPGYAACAAELVAQADARGLRIDRVVHATGSSGTPAGPVAGLCAINAGLPVPGIGTRAPRAGQEAMVHDLAVRTAATIGGGAVVPREAVAASTDCVGKACDLRTEAGLEAIRVFAGLDGLLLGPAKGAAGPVGPIRRKRLGQDGGRIVSLDTGGSFGPPGYDRTLAEAGRGRASPRAASPCRAAWDRRRPCFCRSA